LLAEDGDGFEIRAKIDRYVGRPASERHLAVASAHRTSTAERIDFVTNPISNRNTKKVATFRVTWDMIRPRNKTNQRLSRSRLLDGIALFRRRRLSSTKRAAECSPTFASTIQIDLICFERFRIFGLKDG
jgi:hypothetical protein